MFVVDENTAAAVQSAYAKSGPAGAAAELRRAFPGLSAETALRSVEIIAGWRPLASAPVVGDAQPT